MPDKEFDAVIDRKGTHSTQWDYVEDRFGYSDLLPFTISDMDFATPKVIVNALNQRLEHPVFGYTRWNHDDYKGAIEWWYQERFHTFIEKKWISYSPSVMYSVARLIELNSLPGQGIIIQTPAYDAFYKTINASKRHLVENPLIYTEGTYVIDWEDLESKISDPNNKVLLFCSPHNPTGRVWQKKELDKIVQMCQQYNVFLISDEIHMDVLRPEQKHYPVLKYYEDYLNIAVCSSPSKSFNIPGLGGSYVLLPDFELNTKFQKLLKDRDGVSSASIFGVIATAAAYSRSGEEWINNLNQYIDDNLRLVKEFVDGHLPECQFKIPEATYLAWLDFSQYNFSMEELQKALIEKEKVAIMSGETYGGNGNHFLRLNVGCPRTKVQEGLNRLKSAVDYLLEV